MSSAPSKVASMSRTSNNLASVLDSHPDSATAILSRGVATTYGELRAKVASMRGALDGLGVGRGDRVALLCGNTLEFVVSYFACLGRGIVCVPLNPTAPAPELQRELAVVGARAVVVAPSAAAAWSSVDHAALPNLAHVIAAAHGWGLPVMAEMVPGGFDSPPGQRTPEAIALAARVAAELGADWVKTPYTPGFQQVVSSCYVPVVVLGGAKRGSEAAMLADIRAAICAGGAGVAIGRNIFQAQEPQAMTAAVAQVVHGE